MDIVADAMKTQKKKKNNEKVVEILVRHEKLCMIKQKILRDLKYCDCADQILRDLKHVKKEEDFA